MTTIAVFLPLAFVEGIAGQLFKDQALTVTFALIASLILAMTLIPMLSALGASGNESHPKTRDASSGRRQEEGLSLVRVLAGIKGFVGAVFGRTSKLVFRVFDQGYGAVARGYDRLLASALRHPGIVVLLSLMALLASAVLANRLSLELVPSIEQGEFQVAIELPAGSRIESTDALIARIQTDLEREPDIARTYSVSGTGGRLDASAVSGGENLGNLVVVLAADSRRLVRWRVSERF